MRRIPRYSTLLANYPNPRTKSTHDLLDEVGGPIREKFSDATNTCAIRMSMALNKSGVPIHSCAGVFMMKGQTPPSPPNLHPKKSPSWYVVRAKEMRIYLDRVFGRGRLVYDGSKKLKPSFPHRHTQGIIAFDWMGPWAGFQAGGHVDLLSLSTDASGGIPQNLPNCEGHCYFLPDLGPMRAYFWETNP